MNKLDYLNKSIKFLRKVVKERKKLNGKGIGYIPHEAKVDIPNIEYALTTIKSSDQMQKYLERKEAIIRFLIPSNWGIWYTEFEELLHQQLN